MLNWEKYDLIASGHFSQGDTNLAPDPFLHQDQYMLFADYQSYVECQDRASQLTKIENWTRMSILNVARMGKFSSDRAIRGILWKSGR